MRTINSVPTAFKRMFFLLVSLSIVNLGTTSSFSPSDALLLLDTRSSFSLSDDAILILSENEWSCPICSDPYAHTYSTHTTIGTHPFFEGSVRLSSRKSVFETLIYIYSDVICLFLQLCTVS